MRYPAVATIAQAQIVHGPWLIGSWTAGALPELVNVYLETTRRRTARTVRCIAKCSRAWQSGQPGCSASGPCRTQRLPCCRFTFALNINAGNQINIEAPPGFILTCAGLSHKTEARCIFQSTRFASGDAPVRRKELQHCCNKKTNPTKALNRCSPGSTEGALKQISLPGGKHGPLQLAGASLLHISRHLQTCFPV